MWRLGDIPKINRGFCVVGPVSESALDHWIVSFLPLFIISGQGVQK